MALVICADIDHTTTWGISMDIVARLIDNLEFELENLESLIELSKGADIEVHRNFIKAFTIVSHALACMVRMRSLLD